MCCMVGPNIIVKTSDGLKYIYIGKDIVQIRTITSATEDFIMPQIAKLHWPNDGSHWLQLALACQQWANEVYQLAYQDWLTNELPLSCQLMPNELPLNRQ